jgi:hypothetical protein
VVLVYLVEERWYSVLLIGERPESEAKKRGKKKFSKRSGPGRELMQATLVSGFNFTLAFLKNEGVARDTLSRVLKVPQKRKRKKSGWFERTMGVLWVSRGIPC